MIGVGIRGAGVARAFDPAVLLGPSLDLIFSSASSLDPQITFTRASSATFFDSAGVLQSAANNVPRFDYNPATLAARGLLIEEARTNLLTYSEEFDDASWTKLNSSVTANAVVAPDGTLTGDLLIPNTTNAQHRLDQTPTSTTTSQTFSVYAKAGGYNFVGLRIGGSGTSFNLSTGAVSASGSGSVGSITAVGNGWYRCSIVVAAAAANDIARINVADAATPAASFAGDGFSGIYIWGAQLEAGAFPTSYIPTTTTALTRAADVASVNTLSPWFNASEGTLFAEAQWFGLTANDYYMAFNDGTSNNVLGIGINSAGNFRFVAIVGGSTEASIISGAATINTTFKHAGAYELNNYAATANGASPNQDTTANVPSGISSMSLNSSLGTTNQLNGYLRRITYYPRRLSNAELQAITA
jgi:hypothetical protein